MHPEIKKFLDKKLKDPAYLEKMAKKGLEISNDTKTTKLPNKMPVK